MNFCIFKKKFLEDVVTRPEGYFHLRERVGGKEQTEGNSVSVQVGYILVCRT